MIKHDFCFLFTVGGMKDPQIDSAIRVCKKFANAFSFSWNKKRYGPGTGWARSTFSQTHHQVPSQVGFKTTDGRKSVGTEESQVLGACEKSRHLVPTWQESMNKSVHWRNLLMPYRVMPGVSLIPQTSTCETTASCSQRMGRQLTKQNQEQHTELPQQ